ncbi:TIGR02680 family protein [Streptomyces acidiscabies]|uniref:TIGR02680 family protein n=4 Tax=Streptomyces acidiscabies TaxID=42234 RepID=A0AAP6BBS0_9ACTN|nr:TIGR02680 family protein [Streptomyces acidiscabies]MBZ3917876.1 TIGR02680 family protein [Streptomyces acidiscabies]MDX2961846.1 TIGR02680 family protein [Streptomyces acidiscabies]MDX3023407.1 TIGR02680 family protein [Streptomyces acidiscabies]MDX3789387.1 TIGR02680 family protein [Streptomyces acidiscabies]
MTALPSPAPGRWRPLRIGLVDLFYYDTEEFWFRDGRLLLRGNNGTGKSKVLALTLPFLLDGDLSARRVEPDADPGKRMEWNLLLGGQHPHPERLGYTWIEFGRRDETDGQEHFLTLACGLKAVEGRGIARHWYAVTDQRIGADLSLLDATGTALSRDRLAEALAGRGMVYDTATAYRRAVDEALFGLGERRYAALVDLLVQLRQPQLSKRPNEAALSRALTEALPPMDQAVIADVAEAFRSLDEEKEELRAAGEAERAASAFLDHYRRYARVAARRRARLPRHEHARYEQLGRDLAQAQTDRAAAEEERELIAGRIADLEESATRLKAQDAALREGPEMRSARELEQAAAGARRTAGELRRAEADREQAAQVHTRALGRSETAGRRLTAAEQQVADTLGRAREAASAARLDGEVRTEGAPEPELRRAAEESVARRRRTLDHVEELAARAEEAAAERRAAARRLDEAQSEAGHTARRQAEAESAAAEAGRELVASVREHLDVCEELKPADPAGLLDSLQDWVTHLRGPSPARVHTADAHRTRAAHLADAAASLGQRLAVLEARRAEAERELGDLEAGGQRGPTAPDTRTPGVRDRAPGAALWRLVDFRAQVGAGERAGLEAALEASGLLDAWVCPDGTALRGDGHDVLVSPGDPLPGSTLAEVLRPAVDHGDARALEVGERTVARLLAAVGLGSDSSGDTWVAADGRFRVGALRGSWSKESAAYVGEGAREEARRSRIAVLGEELGVVAGRLEAVEAERAEVARSRRTLDAELAAVPDDAALRHAHALAGAAVDAAHRARARQDERAGELAEAAGVEAEATAELTDTAAAVNLPADRPGLTAVRRALADYTAVLAALWPALRERADAGRAVAEERAEAESAGTRVAELALRAEESARLATAADERHTTLRATVGTAVAELERLLAATAEALAGCERDQRRSREEHAAAGRRVGHAEGRIEQLAKDVREAAAARAEAVAALQRFAGTGLLAVALPEAAVPASDGGPWAATPAIALARAVEADLSSTDDSDGAWERVQKRLSEEYKKLQDALSRGGHTATATMVEDGMVVDIVYQGRRRTVPELAGALATEVAELARILSAHEREILETHLLTEVAGTLQELIQAAERQVGAMNAELKERPTSTGMRLRLVWRPSRKAPAGLEQARGRLRQSADAWAPEERAAVGEFLQAEIARRQSDDAAGGWLEVLTAALDYRSWHEFGVERDQHGSWVPATGPASGGERVLAMSVPLFAAASSHYATAAPDAPRLVTLDEAFAGVDDDSRAKCLGLLHAFDLDVVMTSEREWACYPQVPGIAIAQLSRVDEIAAVLVTRWEWDGSERLRGAEPEHRLMAGEESDADQEALWA